MRGEKQEIHEQLLYLVEHQELKQGLKFDPLQLLLDHLLQ
jgi:hypothetical protein